MAVFHLSAFADEAGAEIGEQITTLKANGITGVELRSVWKKNISDFNAEDAEEAYRRFSEAGITVTSLGSPFGKIQITDDFAPHQEKFLHGLELCELLGTRHIRMFSFYVPEDSAPYRDEVFRRVDWMCTQAQKADVQLLHENEKHIYGDTAERCLELFQRFSGRMLGVFDPANFIQCGVDPLEAIDLLKDYISYMHVKDALASDGSVVPCGKGNGHVAQVLDLLSRRADGMVLSLEPHLKVFDGLAGLQQEEVKHVYAYPDKREAFAAAADAMKTTLTGMGFIQMKGGEGTWIR